MDAMEELEEGDTLGVGRGRGLHLEGAARLLDVHRVRPLPVAVPGVEHREAAVAQAAHHGAARPRRRQGALPAGAGHHDGDAEKVPGGGVDGVPGVRTAHGRRRRVVSWADCRSSATPATTRDSAHGVQPARPGRRHRPGRAVVVHDLRRVRRAVPGRHRARRPHHRHAALPDAHRVGVPERARRAVQEPRGQGQPVGHGRPGAARLGQGPAVPGQGARPGRREGVGRRVAVLGRLRRCLRGPREEDDPRGGRAARHRRGVVRGARRRRDVHRRLGAAGRQRAALPDAGRAERLDVRRVRRHQGRRHLRALLQHDQERVRRRSAGSTRSCTTPSCSTGSCATRSSCRWRARPTCRGCRRRGTPRRPPPP